MRLNLDTFESVAFSNTRRGDYDFANFSLAVTKDGQYIALAGRNVGYQIYRIDTACGAEYVDQINHLNRCSSVLITDYIQQELELDSMHNVHARDASFEEENKLSLYFGSSPNWKVVSIMPESYTEDTDFQYLALGDSVSSGEGDTEINPATNWKYYRTYTDNEENLSINQPREKCHLSTRSYPYRLGHWMQLALDSPQQWSSVACSGATTTDIHSRGYGFLYQGQKKGQPDLFGIDKPRLEGYDNREILQVDALNEMIPGRIEQIQFVKKYKPKVITLTAGANDIEFSNKLKSCITLPTTCDWATTKRGDLASQIQSQFRNLTKLYKDLYDASGNKAKIYVLGYPNLISDSEPAACQPNIGLLNLEERILINQSTNYLNQVIEAAAQSAGVKYIDISNSLSDGRLCDESQEYVTGLAFQGRSELQESFHPNDKGHIMIAQNIKESVQNQSLLSYDICPTVETNTCPDQTITAPDVPVYFGTSTNSRATSALPSTLVKTLVTSLQLPKFSFKPSSQINITLFSNPIDLGNIAVGQDGSIDSSITIPSTAPAGYHTLVLAGETYSGEPIELTQSIVIHSTDPNDLDENNVLDDTQACGLFISTANQDNDFDGIDDACDPEITEPILYIGRNGHPARGEDSAKIYLYRNTRASSITGITNDYVDNTFPNNTEALVASSLSSLEEGVFRRFLMIEDQNDPSIKIPTILAHDSNNTCFALQAVDYISPALNPTDQNYEPRGFTRLAHLPDGQSCEE